MRIIPFALAAFILAAAPSTQAQREQVPAVQQQPSAGQPPHAGAQAQPQLRPGRQLSDADRRFMAVATHSGHAEVEAGRLAQSLAGSEDVREYGRRLVADHQAATTQLDQIARGHGVRLPAHPSVQQRDWLDLLAGLRGAAFEQRFLQQMMEDHREAIDMFSRVERARAHDRALRGYARQILPVLREHLEAAQRLHAQGRLAAARASGAGPAVVPATSERHPVGSHADELASARQQVHEAIQVVQRMKSDPAVARLLERARGVFIVPNYARGALGLGVQMGQGVLVTRNGNGFGGPAFYNMGGVSVGPQAGLAGGEVALLLMTERAVQQFRSDRKFSLTLDAGLTIADYSARGHASTGKVQDVVLWSGTRGAYAGISAGLTDVFADNNDNRAYYGRADASPLTILSGRLEDPYGNALGRVLGA